MEVKYFSEASVDFQWTVERRYIPESITVAEQSLQLAAYYVNATKSAIWSSYY
jgi:hypothetical protein